MLTEPSKIQKIQEKTARVLDNIAAQHGRTSLHMLNTINAGFEEFRKELIELAQENIRLQEEIIKLRSEKDSAKNIK